MATQGFSTMGIDVKVGESALNYVTDIGDIGAAQGGGGVSAPPPETFGNLYETGKGRRI